MTRVLMANAEKKGVRFDPCPQYYTIPYQQLTPEEIEQNWWTQSEMRATRRVCQRIAKESKKFCFLSELVDALHRLITSKTFCNNAQMESYLLDTIVAIRFVRCICNVAMLRGLEYPIFIKHKKQSTKTRTRICHMQRLPGMNAELLCRVAQYYSSFDRIMARLLGEADALYEHERREEANGKLQYYREFDLSEAPEAAVVVA